MGLLTKKQLKVLELRSKGLSQAESARELGTTRANVSMIEWRARRNILKARQAVQAYEQMLMDFRIEIPKGTKLENISVIVLKACGKQHVNLQSSIEDVIRIVMSLKPNCVVGERTGRAISFRVGKNGKLLAE